jgi:hypothetical protein
MFWAGQPSHFSRDEINNPRFRPTPEPEREEAVVGMEVGQLVQTSIWDVFHTREPEAEGE